MDIELTELKKLVAAIEQERDRLLRQIKKRESHYLNLDKKRLWLENQLLRHQLEQFQRREIKPEEQNQKLKTRPRLGSAYASRSRLFDW